MKIEVASSVKNVLYLKGLRIVDRLQKAGFFSCFAGGFVRDMLMGKTPHDIDIATQAKPEEILELFPHTHQVGASFGVICVIDDGDQFELATFREEREYSDGRHPDRITYTNDPRLDSMRRDFTINAMFFDPLTEDIYDYHDGCNDLRYGRLRCVGEAKVRFAEDYLRIMRAVRFAVRFNLEIDKDISASIPELAPCLELLSKERIRDELNKILCGLRPSRAFRMMKELKILDVILPDIAAMSGLEQPVLYHPEGDVFEHTMLMLDHMSFPSPRLAWAILLHDVGKLKTQTFGEDGIPHFYGHETSGKDISRHIMTEYKMSSDDINIVSAAVKNHMRFAHIDKMKKAKWMRIMSEENFPLELELHRIDCISSNGLLDNYLLCLDRIQDLSGALKLPPPLLTGRDLLEQGMKSGPYMGQVLKQIQDLQLEGTLKSKEEALLFVKELQHSKS